MVQLPWLYRKFRFEFSSRILNFCVMRQIVSRAINNYMRRTTIQFREEMFYFLFWYVKKWPQLPTKS